MDDVMCGVTTTVRWLAGWLGVLCTPKLDVQFTCLECVRARVRVLNAHACPCVCV